jgi:hypothetical protein
MATNETIKSQLLRLMKDPASEGRAFRGGFFFGVAVGLAIAMLFVFLAWIVGP